MAWDPRGNIRGPTGPQGPQGPPGTDASVTTASVRSVGGVIGTGITDAVRVTRAQFDALGTKDPETLYVIIG